MFRETGLTPGMVTFLPQEQSHRGCWQGARQTLLLFPRDKGSDKLCISKPKVLHKRDQGKAIRYGPCYLAGRGKDKCGRAGADPDPGG